MQKNENKFWKLCFEGSELSKYLRGGKVEDGPWILFSTTASPKNWKKEFKIYYLSYRSLSPISPMPVTIQQGPQYTTDFSNVSSLKHVDFKNTSKTKSSNNDTPNTNAISAPSSSDGNSTSRNAFSCFFNCFKEI